MKKLSTAILVFDLVAGLLFFGLWESRRIEAKQNETTVGDLKRAENAMVQGVVSVNTAKQTVQEDLSVPEICKIAITFDDGPHPYYTEQLLDGLKERGVCATFFVTGSHAKLHPDVIERMQEEGHLIGNHTYNHIQLTKENREIFKQELVQTNEILEEITGEEVAYVRPPYGSWDKSFEKELNMFPVLWTIDPLDWCSTDAAAVTERIVSKAQENGIILMHDYYETSVTAALQAVDALSEAGYTFVTVDEILFD